MLARGMLASDMLKKEDTYNILPNSRTKKYAVSFERKQKSIHYEQTLHTILYRRDLYGEPEELKHESCRRRASSPRRC